MNHKKLKEIKARLEGTTDGPWVGFWQEAFATTGPPPHGFTVNVPYETGKTWAGFTNKKDLDLITHSRGDIPELVEMIEECVDLMRQMYEGDDLAYKSALKIIDDFEGNER